MRRIGSLKRCLVKLFLRASRSRCGQPFLGRRVLLADVQVGAGIGALEEGCPEIVDGVARGDGEDAFLFEAAGGREHLELEGEAEPYRWR